MDKPLAGRLDLLWQQVRTFLHLRLMAVVLLGVVGVVAGLLSGAAPTGFWLPLALWGVALLYGVVVYRLVYRQEDRQEGLLKGVIRVTVVLDLLMLTVLTQMTGGIASIYALLPFLYLLAAAPLIGPRPTYAGAAWSIFLYGMMLALELSGVLPYGGNIFGGREVWEAVYSRTGVVVGIWLIISGMIFLGAFLGSMIAGWMRQRREEVVQLYRASQKEARKLRLLNEVSRSLTAILSWPTLLARIFAELEPLVAFDYAGLYLYGQEQGRLRLVATRGFSDREAREAEVTAMERHPGWVLRNRCTLFVPDTRNDPRVRYVGPRQSGSVVMVPLLYHDRCLGVLGLGSRRVRAFSEEERGLLEGLAGQLAVVVENVRLFDESRRRLEALRQAQEKLIQSGRLAAVGELMAGLSHELNNPLAVIITGLQVVLEGEGLDAETRRTVEMTMGAAERIARLVRVMGDLQVLGEESFHEVQVGRLIDDALGAVRSQMEQAGVLLEKRVAEALPPVWGSQARLFQVLQHLLQNALEAMAGQERERRLTVSAFLEAGEVVISVRDTGPGLSPEEVDHILEPSFTTKVEEGRARGLGLGLFASYYTLRAHGGDLQVISQVGVGTEVEARLPLSGPGGEGLPVGSAGPGEQGRQTTEFSG